MRRMFGLGLALAVPGAASAEPIAVAIVEWGLVQSRDIKTVPAPGTTSGVATEGGAARLILRTERVEACPGVHFGAWYVATSGLAGDSAPATVEVRHPPFVALGQTAVTAEPIRETVTAKPRYFGWAFEQDYERVEGEWIFAVVVDGADAAVKTFEVVRPEFCGRPDS